MHSSVCVHLHFYIIIPAIGEIPLRNKSEMTTSWVRITLQFLQWITVIYIYVTCARNFSCMCVCKKQHDNCTAKERLSGKTMVNPLLHTMPIMNELSYIDLSNYKWPVLYPLPLCMCAGNGLVVGELGASCRYKLCWILAHYMTIMHALKQLFLGSVLRVDSCLCPLHDAQASFHNYVYQTIMDRGLGGNYFSREMHPFPNWFVWYLHALWTCNAWPKDG